MSNFVTKGQMFEYKKIDILLREEMDKLGKEGWECFSVFTDKYEELVLFWKREYYDFGIDGIMDCLNKKD